MNYSRVYSESREKRIAKRTLKSVSDDLVLKENTTENLTSADGQAQLNVNASRWTQTEMNELIPSKFVHRSGHI